MSPVQLRLELIDWTGRQIRDVKTGRIQDHPSPFLTRLELDSTNWVDTTQHFGSRFGIAAGHWQKIKDKAADTGPTLVTWYGGFQKYLSSLYEIAGIFRNVISA